MVGRSPLTGIIKAFLMKITLASFTLTLAGIASAQNLVQNGSFENGLFTDTYGYGYQFVEPFDTNFPSWMVSHYELLRGKNGVTYDGLTSSDGDYFLDLTGSQNNDMSVITQTIQTTPGQHYRLSVDLGLAPHFNGYDQEGPITLRAHFGADSSDFNYHPTVPGMDWKTFSADFVAVDSFTQIQLEGVSKPSQNSFFGLDNVKVEAVPEPTTIAALGLGAVAMLRRRKRS